MGYALAKEQQRYVSSLVKSGRFNNQSEAVREAIRRMQAQETEYLTPPPLTPAQVESIYGKQDKQEKVVRCGLPREKGQSRECLGCFRGGLGLGCSSSCHRVPPGEGFQKRFCRGLGLFIAESRSLAA
jgi:hypothetical protein